MFMSEHTAEDKSDAEMQRLIVSAEAIKRLIIKRDPGFADLDLDSTTEDGRFEIMLLGALMAGAEVEMTGTDADGRTETMSVSQVGTAPDGDKILKIAVSSPDGTLAPDTAELLAQPMIAHLDDELKLL